ncbi:MAG: hypothetical protein GXP05_16075 [Alphaproteobacteria bacterium]|nr:hypothetical protein [Alphaproteobacteria bacterium]
MFKPLTSIFVIGIPTRPASIPAANLLSFASAVTAIMLFLAGSANAQNWGSMSYNCYHYLTGAPVSCDDAGGGSEANNETFVWQQETQIPEQTYQPAPVPSGPTKAQIAANLRAKREHDKIEDWQIGNARFYDKDFEGALGAYLKARNQCLQWDLADCDALRTNIAITRKEMAHYALRDEAISNYRIGYDFQRQGDLKTARKFFKRVVDLCTEGGTVCKEVEDQVRIVSASLLSRQAVSVYDQNPKLALGKGTIVSNIAFDLFFDCEDPESQRCQSYLDLWMSSKSFVEQATNELTESLESQAADRLPEDYSNPFNNASPFAYGSKASTARLYLELLTLPEPEDVDYLFAVNNTEPDKKKREYALLDNPMALLAKSAIWNVRNLFETNWWTLSFEEDVKQWNDITNGVVAEELPPVPRLDVDKISSAALVFAGDVIMADATPSKVDLMLAALHYANVLEKELKTQGYSISSAQKWESSDIFLRVLFLEAPSNPITLQAVDALTQIRRGAVLK